MLVSPNPLPYSSVRVWEANSIPQFGIIMTTDYKITELFCVIDEFCKHFDAGNLLEDNSMASFKDVMITCSNIFQP